MKKLLISGLLVATIGFALAENEKFSSLDAARDGLNSVAETKSDSVLSESFVKLDLNEDGHASELELKIEDVDSMDASGSFETIDNMEDVDSIEDLEDIELD